MSHPPFCNSPFANDCVTYQHLGDGINHSRLLHQRRLFNTHMCTALHKLLHNLPQWRMKTVVEGRDLLSFRHSSSRMLDCFNKCIKKSVCLFSLLCLNMQEIYVSCRNNSDKQDFLNHWRYFYFDFQDSFAFAGFIQAVHDKCSAFCI